MSSTGRLKATARRETKRAQAAEWLATEYKVLKVEARLDGLHVPWEEFDALPLMERYQKRALIRMWVRNADASFAYRVSHVPHKEKTVPHSWLDWKWTYVLRPRKGAVP